MVNSSADGQPAGHHPDPDDPASALPKQFKIRLFNRSAHSAWPGHRVQEACWLASGALSLPEMCRVRNHEDMRIEAVG